jgi:hypothetical protein
MFRCDHPSGVAVLEPPTPVRLRNFGGYFKRGSAQVASEGTIIDAEWLNMLQEELCNAVILNRAPPDNVLDKSKRDQLLQMIIEISPGGPGGGTGGAQIPEPLNDGFAWSRFRTDPDPGPPATGDWWHALKDAPTSPGGAVAYSRKRDPGEDDGEWVVSTGRRRPTPGTGPSLLYVEKIKPDGTLTVVGDGEGTLANPFRLIQEAIDFACENIDAAGIGVNILVGPHDRGGSSVPWEGFEVIRKLVGCPPNEFKIIGQTIDPNLCILKRIGSGEKGHCCIYVNGGRVNIGGFRIQQPESTVSAYARGVGILCEGSGSVVTLDNAMRFDVVPNSLDHLWANAGGVIKVNFNYTIYGGGALTAQQQNHMHVSNGGMIIYMENFTCTFSAQPSGGSPTPFCVNFILAESGGIARLRNEWRIAGTVPPVTPTTNMKKWYVSGNAVIDCRPPFVMTNPVAPTPPVFRNGSLVIVPGVDPVGQNGGTAPSDRRWTGGRYIPEL